ncbi:hypothetical protein GCM10022280_18650 [Sphingomonas swuensis]|uniref:Uracil-DNA glycosylase n=1 Tax=Sphingomonas swuensis TaxID=977800 RepID=A0ABP7T157_9SPHN
MTINARLRALYADWKCGLRGDDPMVAQLSPPDLVCVPDGYEQASSRVVYVGQEQMGWSWSQRSLDEYDYGTQIWPHSSIESWLDFITAPDSVDALMAGYRLFDFAQHQPLNHRSPFWRQYRRFAAHGAACTTNLDRTSWKGGAIDDGPPEMRAYIANSGTHKLLRDELAILAPTICLFMTGPHRDHLIKETCPGVRFEPLSPDIPREQLGRLICDGLPPLSFRTYHPSHLSRCNKGFYLDLIESQLAHPSAFDAGEP